MSKAERHRQAGAKDRAAPAPPEPAVVSPPPLPPQVAPPKTVSSSAAPPNVPVFPPLTKGPTSAAPVMGVPAIKTGAPQPAAPATPKTVPKAQQPLAKPAPAKQVTKPAADSRLSLRESASFRGAKGDNAAPPVKPSEEVAVDLKEEAVKNAPPFLISMLVHMILVIVLALVTFRDTIEKQIDIVASYMDRRGDQLIDDSPLQSPDGLVVETPAFSLGAIPVDDPFASPLKLPDFTPNATQGAPTIEAPTIGLALTGREAGMKKALLAIYGASATTEGSVVGGLEWLKKQQMRDGGWSLVGPYPDGAVSENRCAATAMALLAFQGYGTTHQSSALKPDFHDVVERGWNYLLKTQDKDGFFQHEGSHNNRLYAQAQATIAICEIYGMTKDPKFKKPAQLALDFAHKAQSPELGGWRYQPRLDSDTSVTGWYVMAFQSGLMAGLEVQSPNLDMINKFLDRVAHEDGSQYSYQIGGQPLLSMTAEALLCRQYLGWKHDDPRMRAGIDLLLQNRIEYKDDPNVYYWYYATQACHHMDGEDWNRWNEALRREVPAAQIKTGSDRGSWPVASDRWGPHGGRLYVTCLSVFMLETYYRHLPIYKWRLQ